MCPGRGLKTPGLEGGADPAARTTPQTNPNSGPHPHSHPSPNQVGLRVHHGLVDVLLHDPNGATVLYECGRRRAGRAGRVAALG